MKNTIIVLTVLLLAGPVLAQDDAGVVYPELNSFLQAEKARHGLLRCNNDQCDYKRFIKLYNQQNQARNRSTERPVTFIDGRVVYSIVLPAEGSRNTVTLYQRYSESVEQPSLALGILGFVGGITAAAVASKYHHYSGFNNESPVQAYLQSTYHQDHRK